MDRTYSVIGVGKLGASMAAAIAKRGFYVIGIADIMENSPPCQRMSIENAELTKISVNTFVTTKITFANMLADLCERIPGGDVDVVTQALGMDSRIGKKYLTGAIGMAAPVFRATTSR